MKVSAEDLANNGVYSGVTGAVMAPGCKIARDQREHTEESFKALLTEGRHLIGLDDRHQVEKALFEVFGSDVGDPGW